MYQPITSQLNLVQEDDGTNSPMMHQLVISKLPTELGLLFYHKKEISLVPLPETPLNEGPGHAVPDLILYDQIAEETKVIIEVCQTNGQRNNLRKLIYLIDDNDYGILEGFVYNYRTNNGFATAKAMVGRLQNRLFRRSWVSIWERWCSSSFV